MPCVVHVVVAVGVRAVHRARLDVELEALLSEHAKRSTLEAHDVSATDLLER